MRTGDIAVQQLDAQRAAQAEAESQYRSALDNVTAAETGVVQAQARYTAAIATTSAAAAGIGAEQGQLTTAEGKLAEADTPARVATTQAQADAALAQATSLRAQLKTAQDRLGYTRVTSPIDGIVLNVLLRKHQRIRKALGVAVPVPTDSAAVIDAILEGLISRGRPGEAAFEQLSLDIGEVMHLILAKVAELLKPRNWSVLLCDARTGELTFKAALGAGSVVGSRRGPDRR